MGSGAAGSPEAASRLCEALRAAGVVVRVGGTVFLRPDEVAETILKARCAALCFSGALLMIASWPCMRSGCALRPHQPATAMALRPCRPERVT